MRTESRKCIDTAKMVFMQNGFSVSKKGERDFEFIGPGMASTKENPLLGVSMARIKLNGRQFTLEADLKSLRGLQWFIRIFPFALGGILFLVLNGSRPSGSPVNWVALLAVSPWIVLSPWMSRWIKKRSIRALDVLIENAVCDD